ncbi:MAG: transposase [Thomasclavelia spiroformis]
MSRKQLPQYLCIDEVYAFKSEKSRYICVLFDFQSQNIVDVLPSRRKQVLLDYFFNIPLSERKKVKVVSFDMWESYRIVSKIMFPDALCAVDHLCKILHKIIIMSSRNFTEKWIK